MTMTNNVANEKELTMSEARAISSVLGLDQDPNPATLLPFSAPDFVEPTEVDLRAVMKRFGLTGSQVASFTGIKPRNTRKWTSPKDTKSHVQIPYASWRILLITCGLVEPETIEDLPAKRSLGRPRREVRIAFESGARFITAFCPDGEVMTRCRFHYTDCDENEPLDDFVRRHGGPELTAKYLAMFA